jgi:general stress protein YciG
MSSDDNRGLASADEQTKEKVARKGGEASHDERGLQAASEETKERVAREGGEASHSGGRND